MSLDLLFSKDCSKAAVLFNSKKRMLEYLSQVAHQHIPHLSEQAILDSLLAREKLGSTGIGKGVAIPHGRLEGIENTLAIIVTNREAINFDAIDNRPVDIFVALLVPGDQCDQHLKTLAKIADKLKDKQFCKQLRSVTSDQELYQLMVA
ncbi:MULTISPECIES: PTS IIA-like nitrogen regulatory protein PtsN [unclassified Pseudoalteromonas]|uniref:PTS IIA-like nitrogen regulatory protein PtsN n=1 Tax=unclassified Pseudoalteromonas TaxID=194690 RepID=UPI000CF72D20|nr:MULTISPECIES: PTS IIA-like nitrogen regulatory protein PtsN [unclassified Pseudoalteromonas]